MWVAEQHGRPVGYVAVRIHSDDRTGEIEMLAVNPLGAAPGDRHGVDVMVVVPLEVFQRGQFPPVCVKTGRPAELVGQAEAVAATSHAWSLIRWLPVVGRLWPAGRRTTGDVPITRAAVRRITCLRWAWVAAFLPGVAIVRGPGATGASPSMLLAGRILMAIAAVLWLLAGRFTVEARWYPQDRTVELQDVHPGFKAAVEHGLTREPAQGQVALPAD